MSSDPRDISRELEARLRLDEGDDDYSFLQPPSVVSSLEQLSARADTSQRGESFVGRAPRRATSLPGSFQGGGSTGVNLDTPRGSSSLQSAIFIDETIAPTLCLGVIGSSGRFCVAKKTRGANHCGTVAHAKSKALIIPGSFYTPAGTLLGKASAKLYPSILRSDIPRFMLQIFETGLMSTTRWESMFKDAIVKGPSTPPRSSARDQSRSVNPSPIHEQFGDGVEMESGGVDLPGGISFLRVDELESAGTTAAPVWSTSLEGVQVPTEWTPVAREERAAIERICEMVDNLNIAVPKIVRALNTEYHPLIRSQGEGIKLLHDGVDAFRGEVGPLLQLVADHGSLSQAVERALAGNNTSLATMQSLEEELHAFAEELAVVAENADTSKETLLNLINRVSAAATRRSDALEQRLRAVEGSGTTPHWQQSRTAGPSGAGLTGDTSFGTTTVGSAEVELTMNSLLSQVRTLESRLQAVSDRTRSTGVVFHRLAFASEADFRYWYLSNNPQGDGPSAFVDIVSIWAFGSAESGTAEWLVDLHRSQSIGFKASPDTLYAHSMTTRYPKAFVGKVDTIRSADTIKMLASVDDWRGNGMGDGFKERLLNQLQHAVQSHAAYCEDYLPDGPLRQAALRTAQVTQHFFQTLAAYLDDELSMLSSFNLPAKQTLLLLSNQVVHICDDLFEFRNQAKGVDVSNKAICATRYAWVTLQALGCMENYLREKFRKHPGINSTYMRFLTRNLADQSSIGLKTKLEALSTKLTKVEVAIGLASTKAALEKLDGKLELIIRANSLKRTAG